jgi:POT family proton-dependent oligopeptide transporter
MLNLIKQEHPKGLYLLFFVEMWERFSYYGMRALLVLYMVQQMAFGHEKAGHIYGLYTGFVYLTPLLGGYLADKYIGQRKCITTGGVLMCLGLFMLASGLKILFLPSLFVMVLANGFFKSNISSVLGILYGKNNEKKDSGFTIFYMGINLGAFFSPLICGTLALRYGFSYGFGSAGIGMLIGIFIYLMLGDKCLGECGKYPVQKEIDKANSTSTKLTKREKNKLVCLFVLMLFTIVFWTCYEQAGCSLTLFAEYATNRNILGHTIPTEYFQSLNPLYIIIFAPLMSLLWSYLHTKRLEPTSVEKFTLALGLMSVAYTVMAVAGDISEHSLVSSMWLIVVYFIMTISELCISPIGLSLVSKLAPRKFISLLMGSWFLTSFFGNIFAGFWGGKYGSISNTILFLTLAIISLISAVILGCILPRMKRLLGRI